MASPTAEQVEQPVQDVLAQNVQVPAGIVGAGTKPSVHSNAPSSQFKSSRPESSVYLRPEDAERVIDAEFEAYCSKLYMYLQVRGSPQFYAPSVNLAKYAKKASNTDML
jgi:hypothetical protein